MHIQGEYIFNLSVCRIHEIRNLCQQSALSLRADDDGASTCQAVCLESHLSCYLFLEMEWKYFYRIQKGQLYAGDRDAQFRIDHRRRLGKWKLSPYCIGRGAAHLSDVKASRTSREILCGANKSGETLGANLHIYTLLCSQRWVVSALWLCVYVATLCHSVDDVFWHKIDLAFSHIKATAI